MIIYIPIKGITWRNELWIQPSKKQICEKSNKESLTRAAIEFALTDVNTYAETAGRNATFKCTYIMGLTYLQVGKADMEKINDMIPLVCNTYDKLGISLQLNANGDLLQANYIFWKITRDNNGYHWSMYSTYWYDIDAFAWFQPVKFLCFSRKKNCTGSLFSMKFHIYCRANVRQMTGWFEKLYLDRSIKKLNLAEDLINDGTTRIRQKNSRT